MRNLRSLVVLALVSSSVMLVAPAFAQGQIGSLKIPNLSQYSLDDSTRGDVVEHKTGIIEPVSRASEVFLVGAAVANFITTGRNISSGAFKEAGLSRHFGFAGDNVIAAIGSSIVLDAGLLALDHWLFKKGGKWRWLALGLNSYQGGVHLKLAVREQSDWTAYQRSQLQVGVWHLNPTTTQ